jgi:hypothetical protein
MDSCLFVFSSHIADYIWTGPTHFQISQLGPEQQMTFQTRLCVLQPGIFNVNRFKFTVRFTDPITKQEKEFTIFHTSAQHLLIVSSSGTSTS